MYNILLYDLIWISRNSVVVSFGSSTYNNMWCKQPIIIKFFYHFFGYLMIYFMTTKWLQLIDDAQHNHKLWSIN